MNEEYYQTVVDKFIFTVKRGLLYTDNEVWVKLENGRVRIGLTDFFQRRVGDIINIDFPEVGLKIKRSEEIIQFETIKAVSSINSPFGGTIVEVNSLLKNKPEVINEDPYGEGWLVLISPSKLKGDLGQLFTAERYFELMKSKIKDEMKRSEKEIRGFG